MNAAKEAADQILAPNYGHLEIPRSGQDLIPTDIVPDYLPEQHITTQMRQSMN